MTSNPPAISIRGLTHRYAKAEVNALNNIGLEVTQGEAFALLGPNGGGKSTTFRILAGLLKPTASNDAVVEVLGHDALGHGSAVRSILGVVFQSPSLDIKLTALENLTCHGRIYGMPRRGLTEKARELLEQMQLADRADERVENFSGGMRRRVEIAKALLPSPKLLLMDEPSTGLDPAARHELWASLQQTRQAHGLTLVWTTHLMDEAEHADRVGILSKGKMLAVESPQTLRDRLGTSVIRIQPGLAANANDLMNKLKNRFSAELSYTKIAVIQNEIRFELSDGPSQVAAIAELLGDDAVQISVGRPTLEDAYLELVARHESPPDSLKAAALLKAEPSTMATASA